MEKKIFRKYSSNKKKRERFNEVLKKIKYQEVNKKTKGKVGSEKKKPCHFTQTIYYFINHLILLVIKFFNYVCKNPSQIQLFIQLSVKTKQTEGNFYLLFHF